MINPAHLRFTVTTTKTDLSSFPWPASANWIVPFQTTILEVSASLVLILMPWGVKLVSPSTGSLSFELIRPLTYLLTDATLCLLENSANDYDLSADSVCTYNLTAAIFYGDVNATSSTIPTSNMNATNVVSNTTSAMLNMDMNTNTSTTNTSAPAAPADANPFPLGVVSYLD